MIAAVCGDVVSDGARWLVADGGVVDEDDDKLWSRWVSFMVWWWRVMIGGTQGVTMTIKQWLMPVAVIVWVVARGSGGDDDDNP